MLYKDRYDAGKQLAQELLQYKNENPVIIALPRGGVLLGYEAAKMLHAPLDIIVARKLGAPFHPEFGFGAIAPNGVKIINAESVEYLRLSKDEINEIIENETLEMNRRIQLYRKNSPPIDLHNKTVIVVDDGLATGVSTKAAVMSIKKMKPQKIILAVPVSPVNTANAFRQEVDEFICLNEFSDFFAVGAYYDNFEQITDEEVITLIQKAKENIS